MPVVKKSVSPMEKTIPKNPKYEHVGSSLDTGASISKYMRRVEENRENFKIQADEIFMRMKLATFVQLILQMEDVREPNELGNCASTLADFPNGTVMGDEPVDTHKRIDEEDSKHSSTVPRSTLEGLISGIGEVDVNCNARQSGDEVIKRQCSRDMPYLLLDLREREEYDACHIITARSYPIAMLSRSINFESQDMLAYRNKPGYVIILYDEDERLGPRAASTLVQRGYSNVFLLSGGLRLAWKRFPEGLIIGSMPLSIRQSLRSKTMVRSLSGSSKLRSISGYVQQSDSYASSSQSNSAGKMLTLYCPIGSRESDLGEEEFCPQDIILLRMAIERGIDDGRSTKSIYTQRTTSTMNRTETNGRKPFRC